MKMSNKIFSALKFITLVLILSIAENAGATHIIGGQLTYRHLGNNSYEVTLTLRRDCTLGQVGYDDPASVGIFSAATNTLISEVRIPFMASDTVGNTIVSKCGFIGSEVCVQRTSYRDTIDLPFLAGGYILAYQRCCRNASLNNVINPLEVGTTEWIEVTEKALLEGNSAPDFKAWPDIYICANQPLVFDHSATDADGDSLVYRICTPFDGGTFTNPRPQPPLAPHYSEILWADPYNLQNVMGGTALVIDPVTGVITANPNIIGQFLIGICVEEYRNGVLISKVRRDFQYNVRQCAEPLVADFDFAVNACDSLSYAFTNKTVDGSSYEWNFNYPSVDPAYISTEVNPTFVFPAPGVYTVRMLARSSNGACDSIVYKQLTASVCSNIPDLNLVASNLTVCPGQRVALLSASNPGNVYTWSPQDGLDLTDPAFPYFQGTQSGVYSVTVTNPALCTNTGTIEIIVRPATTPLSFSGATNVCSQEVDLTVSGGSGNFEWSLNSGFEPVIAIDQRLITTFTGTGATFYVRTKGAECGDLTDSVKVQLQSVSLVYEDEVKICRGDTVTVNISNNNNQHILDYVWNNPHVVSSNGSSVTLTTIPGDGTSYTVRGFVSNQYGCRDTLGLSVQVIDAPGVDFSAALRSCEDETMCFTLTGNYSGELLWDFGTAAANDTSTLVNPCFRYQSGGVFSVRLVNLNASCAFDPVVKSITVPEVGDQEVTVTQTLTNCDDREICFSVGGNYQGNVLWNFGDPGSGAANTSSSAIPCHEFSAPGTYDVTLTNVQPVCPFENVVLKVVIDPLFKINPIPDEIICEGESLQLTASSNDPTAKYQWFNESGVLLGSGKNLTVNTANDTKITLRAVNEKGCTDSTAVNVRVFKFNYSVDIPQVICPGSEYRITLNIGNPDNYTFVWSPSECIVMGGSTHTPLVVAAAGKKIRVEITNKETGCMESKEFMPAIQPPLVYQFAGLLCYNQPSDVVLAIQGQSGYSYQWSPADYIVSGGNTSTPVVKMLPGQELTVLVTNNATGCSEELTYKPDVLSELDIEFTDPVVEINQGRDGEISVKNPVQGGVYVWNTGQTGSSITVDPIATTTYTVTLTDPNGCTAVGQVTVQVRVVGCTDKDEYLPNAFSPNGDGKNDVLYVKSNVITEMTLVIYNRWGREMFRTTDISEGWDGRYNGAELSPDAYAYYLKATCINGDNFIKKGNVSLLR